MLSRSIYIVVLIILVGQLLVPGGILVQPSTPIHPAWILQDRLRIRIYRAAHRRWPFTPGGGGSPQPQKRRGKQRRRRRRRTHPIQSRDSAGTTAPIVRVIETPPDARRQAGRVQPPTAWPTQLLDLMDADACRQVIQPTALEGFAFRQTRWEQGLFCPHCGGWQVEVLEGQVTSAGWQRYACQRCQTPGGYPKTFSDLTGTPWEGTHLRPAQLLVSLASFVEGDSAEALARQLHVQPRVGHRMRRLLQIVLYLHRSESLLTGDVEVDEVYIIGGWKGRPAGIKPPRPPRQRRLKGKRGRGTWESDKVPLVAIVQRNGEVRLFPRRNLQKETFRPLLKQWLRQGTTVYTDDYNIYTFLSRTTEYYHQIIDHSDGEYARGEVHVNTAEALFSLLRPYLATFRGVSKVYLPLYVAAFEFQYNHRYLTKWEQAGILLRLLCQTDGALVRQALRDNKVVELCDLPT